MAKSYPQEFYTVVAEADAIPGSSLNSLANGGIASGSGIALNARTTHLRFTCTFAYSTTSGLTDLEGPGLYLRHSSDGTNYEPSATASKLPMSPIVFTGRANTDVQVRVITVERLPGATHVIPSLVGRGGVALASSGNTLKVEQIGIRNAEVDI